MDRKLPVNWDFREVLVGLRMTQGELANRTGLTDTEVSLLSRGHKKLTERQKIKLRRVFSDEQIQRAFRTRARVSD